jgi:lipid-A-disaccharide synthase
MPAVAPRRVLVVTNEASGDALAAGVVERLRAAPGECDLGHGLGPGPASERLDVRAMGGARLAAAGAELVVDIAATTAMGGVEVAGRLPRLVAAYATVLRLARRWRPDVALLVDAPDWNAPIGRSLRRLGVPVVGYVAPQVWAWRAGRVARLGRAYDAMACVLPFEAAALRRAGLDARFVGHPAAEAPALGRAAAEAALGLRPGARRLALLPGSRPAEVARHLGPMVEAARRLARGPGPGRGAEVVVALAPTVATPTLPPWVVPVRHLAHGGAGRLALAAADAAVVASGTATLEAALAGTPQVVVYRLAPATWAAARILVRTRFVALPNLVLGRRVGPELLQSAATADAVAAVAAPLLEGGAEARAQRAVRAHLAAALHGPGASATVARMLVEVAS